MLVHTVPQNPDIVAGRCAGVAIVDLPVEFDDAPIDPRYSSASGIYVNATVTSRAVYLPQYGPCCLRDHGGWGPNTSLVTAGKCVLKICLRTVSLCYFSQRNNLQ
eukprot:4412057-Amphidinium_carterae.1